MVVMFGRARGVLAKYKYLAAICLLSGVFSLVFATASFAGGPIMSATTLIQGTNRATGQALGNPHSDGRVSPKTLASSFGLGESLPRSAQAANVPVYKGDEVTFYFLTQNWDPYQGWGADVTASSFYTGGGNLGTGPGTTSVNFLPQSSIFTQDQQLHSEKFQHTVTWFGIPDISSKGKYRKECVDRPNNCWMNKDGKELTLKVKADGAGSNVPGNRFCTYIQTDPTIWNEMRLGDKAVLKSKKFNKQSGESYYNTTSTADSNSVWTFFHVELPVYSVALANLAAVPYMLAGTADSIVGLNNQMSCIEIAYVYDLIPRIDIVSAGGNSTAVANSVSQGTLPSGAKEFTASKLTQWQITQFYLDESYFGNEPKMDTSTDDPCKHFNSKYKVELSSCTVPMAGDSTSAKSKGVDTIFEADGRIRTGSKQFPVSLKSADEPPAGKILCYALSIKSYAPYLNPEAWRNSDIRCMHVDASKHPKLQVHGGDIRVGGKIDTSLSTAADQSGQPRNFGSWAEYASFSGLNSPVKSDTSWGKTIGFATKSGLADGYPSGSGDQDFWSALTFANIRPNYGLFAPNNGASLAASYQRFFTGISKPYSPDSDNLNLTDIPSSKTGRLITPKTTLTIEGGAIAPGKTVVLVVNGDVRITKDIVYDTQQLAGIADIPQVVIVANNIKIDQSVRRIDAWLVASHTTGDIDTCDIGKILTKKICNNPLVVNGPVSTHKLTLNRTYGSEPHNPGEPAEIINLNASSHLWSLLLVNDQATAATTYQIEVPPRF